MGNAEDGKRQRFFEASAVAFATIVGAHACSTAESDERIATEVGSEGEAPSVLVLPARATTGPSPVDAPLASPIDPSAAPEDACGALPIRRVGVHDPVGTNAAECIVGTELDDVILGLGGNDIILGLGGDDEIDGGPGIDLLNGGEGNDILRGGTGDDWLDGGEGDDVLLGDGGIDNILGGPGSDVIQGGGAADVLQGGDGNDVILGDHADANDGSIDGGDGIDACAGATGCENPPPSVGNTSCDADEDCISSNLCLTTSCVPQIGCVAAATVCDDGLFCNGVEVCGPSLGCVAGTVPEEDDGIQCTVAVCNELAGIIEHVADHGLCDDGFACTIDRCDPLLDCETPELVEDGTICLGDPPGAFTGTCVEGTCQPDGPCETGDTEVSQSSESGEVYFDSNTCARTFVSNGSYVPGLSFVNAIAISPDRTRLYLHGFGGSDDEFQLIDIETEPDHPEMVDSLDLGAIVGAHEIIVSADGEVYVLQGDGVRRVVITADDASSGELYVPFGDPSPSHLVLAPDGATAYGIHGGGFQRFDDFASFPAIDAMPVLELCPEAAGGCVPRDLAVFFSPSGPVALVAVGPSDVAVFDANSADPDIEFYTPGTALSVERLAVDPVRGLLFTAGTTSFPNGYFQMDVSWLSPGLPVPAGTSPLAMPPETMTVAWNGDLWVGQFPWGLRVYDVSDPQSPLGYGKFMYEHYGAVDIEVSEHRAYMLPSHVAVVLVVDPTDPT